MNNIKPKILAISISPELTRMIKEISKELGIPVSVYEGGIMRGGHLYAKDMENKFDVIISVGGTLEAIKEIVSIPVVSINTKTSDILNALLEAKKKYKKKIILFCYKSDELSELQNLKDILNVDFEVVNYEDREEFIEQINNISKRSDKDEFTLVGMGSCIYKISKEIDLKVNKMIIKNNKKDVRQAIIDSQNICDLSKRKKERTKRLNIIIDYSSEAIIAIDKQGFFTTFNPIAEKILRLEMDSVLGRNIRDLKDWHNIDLIYGNGDYKTNDVIKIDDMQLILNRIPIIVEDKKNGLIITLQEVSKLQKLEHNVRNKLYNKGFIAKYCFDDILGVSEPIINAIDNAKGFGKTSATILIQGETGTGKELFAQSIHNISNRKNKPFVAINCAALPIDLLESELFGYEGGAFTGAKKDGKLGLFEQAHNGTIFLDEISEIPINLQNRLLRVLQEKEVMRIGADHIIKIDVRIISATNIDLYKMVKEHKFREDLYFRLNVLNLMIPSLKERKEDIPLFVNSFIQEANRRYNKNILGVTHKAMEMLMSYSWPGNVREIQNFVERIVILSDNPTVKESFVKNLFIQSFHVINEIEKFESDKNTIKINMGTLEDMELEIIKKCGKLIGDNKTILAEKLGISRTTLWKKIKDLDKING